MFLSVTEYKPIAQPKKGVTSDAVYHSDGDAVSIPPAGILPLRPTGVTWLFIYIST